ncbi:MAG TPA: SDR family oxidoreductase [Candidatus Binatia bacterium]|jgi:NAD(P)-dependent dehydrogenase (short-subunit alcohol dehydrogenase family)
MDTGLKNKVVLITGATRNHGKATALAFAAEGANLLICTRKSMDLLEDTARLAADRGIKVLAKQCDVTVEAQVSDLVQSGLAEFGRIDVLVNNAGQRVHGDVIKLNMEEWRAGLDVNVHALFLTCKAVLPGMVERRWGRIINYTGNSFMRGILGPGTLKMATLGFTRAIAQEYGEFNITANCIAPWAITVERSAEHVSSGITAVRVEGQAIPRRGTIAECAALAVFLASDKAGYITGQNYSVNGGAYFL